MSNKGFVMSHRELKLYQTAFESAMRVFEVAQALPTEERPLLGEQIIRSSRSVCANLAEAWHKRRYKGAFVAKLNEVEAEAAETQTWLEFAIVCDYLDAEVGQELFGKYTEIIAGAARLIDHADAWVTS
ncbi:MAG: four helix bundle protein [Cyanobacteria bacterium P01_G01_bin.38]